MINFFKKKKLIVNTGNSITGNIDAIQEKYDDDYSGISFIVRYKNDIYPLKDLSDDEMINLWCKTELDERKIK